MKAKMIESKEMDLNCWTPYRFFNECYKCINYDRCKYPERKANKEFDESLKALRESRDNVKRMNPYHKEVI